MPPPRLLFLAPGDVRKARVEPILWMRTCEAFAARGVRVTLLTLAIRRPDPVARSQVYEHFGVARSFRVVELPTPLRMPLSTTLFRASGMAAGTLAAALACASAALRGRRWIVYGRSPVMLAPVALLRRLAPRGRRPRLVFETHTLPTPQNLRRLATADLVVVNSDRLADDLHAALGPGGPPVAHVPLPPHNEVRPVERRAARERLGLPQDATLACYTGKLVEDQVEFMLRAAARCRQDVPGFQLVLVGGNPDILEWSERRARELGAADAVRFTGFVAPGEVSGYQSAADVLVFYMSPQLEHFEYCTPAKGYEYQAVGRPIVAVDIPLFGEVFGADGDRVVRVAERTPEALAGGIRRALALAPEDAEAMGERARAWVRSRTWERRADMVLEQLAL